MASSYILVVVDIYIVSFLNVHQNYKLDRETFDKDTEVSTSFIVNKGMDLRKSYLDLTFDKVQALITKLAQADTRQIVMQSKFLTKSRVEIYCLM